ncbi:MAG: NOB1 family endonuclease [Aigarchaeota archaeon]|nr:NOB1 family endonuclease [Candidatus Pelearchaeum maunauluense]
MEKSGKPRVIVLDTSAILSGQLEANPAHKYLTCQGVVDEVRFGNLAPERLEAAIMQGLLIVERPEQWALEKTIEAATMTGDITSLSETDLELIAIALQYSVANYDVSLVSDDYGVQNTAMQLGIRVSGRVHPGIRRVVKWILSCPACSSTFRENLKTCPYCGGELRRKPVKNLST